MSKEILNLAQEITNCRDSELPLKLLKLNGYLLFIILIEKKMLNNF